MDSILNVKFKWAIFATHGEFEYTLSVKQTVVPYEEYYCVYVAKDS